MFLGCFTKGFMYFILFFLLTNVHLLICLYSEFIIIIALNMISLLHWENNCSDRNISIYAYKCTFVSPSVCILFMNGCVHVCLYAYSSQVN